jgi:hypothetical protein
MVMMGTCLLACEGLWTAQVRKKMMEEWEGWIEFGTHLYFDEHWADATRNGGKLVD